MFTDYDIKRDDLIKYYETASDTIPPTYANRLATCEPAPIVTKSLVVEDGAFIVADKV